MSNSTSIFRKMRSRFRNYGWVLGAYKGPQGQVCLSQCMSDSGGGAKEEQLLLRAANELYPRKGGGGWSGIPSFNDHTGRTASQVHAVLNRAEELAS